MYVETLLVLASLSLIMNDIIVPALTQFTINWALLGGALVIAVPTVLSITKSPESQEVGAREKGETDDVSVKVRASDA